jgi:hypothetical protein
MEEYRRWISTVPFAPNLGTRWGLVVNVNPWLLCSAVGEIHAEPIYSCQKNQLPISFSKTNSASRTIFKVLNVHVSTLIMATKPLTKEVYFVS